MPQSYVFVDRLLVRFFLPKVSLLVFHQNTGWRLVYTWGPPEQKHGIRKAGELRGAAGKGDRLACAGDMPMLRELRLAWISVYQLSGYSRTRVGSTRVGSAQSAGFWPGKEHCRLHRRGYYLLSRVLRGMRATHQDPNQSLGPD